MEIQIIKNEKEEIEFELESLTLAEILRVYLNKDSDVTFAAWKREHPTKKPIFLVKTKGKTAKKAIDEAISSLVKDLDNLESDFKKLKF
jgi:DNA-directed RNA polymerase subunit L